MKSLEELFDIDRVLVFGVGGSGDVVGALPTARLLEIHGVEVLLGGMAWEPVPYDTEAGPRDLDELRDAHRFAEEIALVTGETTTIDGLRFTESIVAEYYDERVALFGLGSGTEGLRRDLERLCGERDIDAIIGVDAGGDALAAGSEPGLRSPVTDGYALAALEDVDVESCLGVIGYGSDGELTIDELEAAMARIATDDGMVGAWGLTPRVQEEMEAVLERVDTEASRLPLEAARGDVGPRTIRGGDVELEVKIPATVTFYFDPSVVARQSAIAALVAGSQSLQEATDALTASGYVTEFEREVRRLEGPDR